MNRDFGYRGGVNEKTASPEGSTSGDVTKGYRCPWLRKKEPQQGGRIRIWVSVKGAFFAPV